MNVIVMAADTLRADSLSCYGNAKPTSPNLDLLAKRGVLFENFYSVGNCTHPGFTSMFSGMYPESTGVVSHWTRVAPRKGIRMIAEYFSDAGFTTAAIDNLHDGWRPKHPFYPWFRTGYSFYDYPHVRDFYQPGSEVSKMACSWLRSRPREPFFLFVHYWDTHAPYNKAPRRFYRFYDGDDPCDPRLDYMPSEVREQQRKVFGEPITDPGYVVAAYHGETAYVDECIGKVLSSIRKLGLEDDTVIVFTSDHGDIMSFPRLALGRLWAFCHIGLNEDCLRVPLILSGPGIEEGMRVAKGYQIVDILPSFLDIVGIAAAVNLDGISFCGALRGEDVDGRENLFFSENTYQKQRAVLSYPWKYMRMEAHYRSMPAKSLFNLGEDPWETRNLSDSNEEMVEVMDMLLDDYVEKTCCGNPDPLKVQDITSKN